MYFRFILTKEFFLDKHITYIQKQDYWVQFVWQYDELRRQKRDNLKSTSDLLKDILSGNKISDANLRMLVKQIYVHQNEDKSLDVKFEFNGDFENSEEVYADEESA